MNTRAEMELPVIDIAPLRGDDEASKRQVAEALHQACREIGFFYIQGHGISPTLLYDLEADSRAFFDQDEATKMGIAMSKGGRAWRGYFPVEGELTSGIPDLKEGIYFGQELPTTHPLVQAGVPMYGANLFPSYPPTMKQHVLAFLDAMTELGHLLMQGLSLSLGLPAHYFSQHYTHDPLVLFRIFHYPAKPPSEEQKYPQQWGVGEHTDYGLLTILKQDNIGGLEVKSQGRWLSAPPIDGTFVCNIGDMLDRMTGGLYRSTPHRVRAQTSQGRFSFPFFFDPNFHAPVQPLPIAQAFRQYDDKTERWDAASVHEFQGTYGEYILGKVAKVFPDLHQDTLG